MHRIMFLLAVIALVSCARHGPDALWLQAAVPADSPAGAGARYPHLSIDPAGRVLMSWLEPVDGGMALRHATHDGKGWSTPRQVAAGADWFINWADFPSVVSVAPGVLAAHWLQQRPDNVYSYDIRLAVSRDSGTTWSTPVTPHDDGTPTEHGFVSLFPLGGELGALWLDGRNTGGGHEHDGAMTLRAATVATANLAISNGVEVDHRVCDCCQTDVALGTDGPVAAFRDRSGDETRDIYVARLEQSGWTIPSPVHADGWKIEACPVNGPAIDVAGDLVVVAWFTAPDLPRVRVAFSEDGGRSFGPAVEVDSGQVAGRVDVSLLNDGRAVVSWLTTGDRPVIKARPFDTRGPRGRSRDDCLRDRRARRRISADGARAGQALFCVD